MNLFFKNHFEKFSPKKFVKIITLSLLILDILNTWYMKSWWKTNELSMKMVLKIIASQEDSLTHFNQASLSELSLFITNTFNFFLTLIIINNCFFYFFYLKEKKWAHNYVQFYCLTGSLFSISFIFEGNSIGLEWLIYNILSIPLYFYFYLAIKSFHANPAHERMAQ
jgi:hypothetical protein